MKKFFVTGFSLAILGLGASNTHSQYPAIQVYFDSGLSRTMEDMCPEDPPGTVLDSLYIVAEEFNAWISAIEYRMDYPPEIMWLGDFPISGLTIGNTQNGIAQAWPFPQNAYQPLLIMKILFIWHCQLCLETNIPVCANVHPESGYLRAVRWPDPIYIYGTSKPACICPACGQCACPDPPVPTEETTWGKVKALYR